MTFHELTSHVSSCAKILPLIFLARTVAALDSPPLGRACHVEGANNARPKVTSIDIGRGIQWNPGTCPAAWTGMMGVLGKMM
jgi:hypothetical protein